jgi:DNA-binding MarR family transcriptional regulator
VFPVYRVTQKDGRVRGHLSAGIKLADWICIQLTFTGKLYIWDIDLVSNRIFSAQTGLASMLAAEMRTVFRKLKLRVREHGGGNDLTPSQTSVLLRLEKDGPGTVSSLARAEGMRPQSMSAIVTPLQESGLVSGAPDPSDGRQTLMSLTPKCLKWLQEGRAARQDWLTLTIFQKLSVHEQETRQAALELLTRLAED